MLDDFGRGRVGPAHFVGAVAAPMSMRTPIPAVAAGCGAGVALDAAIVGHPPLQMRGGKKSRDRRSGGHALLIFCQLVGGLCARVGLP